MGSGEGGTMNGTAGVNLQVGDWAVTNYHDTQRKVRITARRERRDASRSGIQFRVDPPLRRGDEEADDAWYDAGWFKPYVA
jgi:hypothetical protein